MDCAQGYLKTIKNLYFILLNKVLYEIFTTMNIATSVLQGQNSSLVSAMQTIEVCKSDVEDFREIYTVEKIKNDLELLNTSHTSVKSSKEKRKAKFLTIVEICDVFGKEFTGRFGKSNVSKWISMQAQSPQSNRFLYPDALLPLFEYARTAPVVNILWSENLVSFSLLEAEYLKQKSKNTMTRTRMTKKTQSIE